MGICPWFWRFLVYPKSTVPAILARVDSSRRLIAAAVTADPWLLEGKASQPPIFSVIAPYQQDSWFCKLTDLYPAARMRAFGHLVLARVKSLFISWIAASLEPAGQTLSIKVAPYGPPTPWTQTPDCPRRLFKALARRGPSDIPYTASWPYSVISQVYVITGGGTGGLRSRDAMWRRWGEQTIFPGSVDPRAYMKMT